MRISFESFAMWINPIRDFVRRIKLSDEVLVYKAADEEEEDSHILYGKPPPFSIALPIQLLAPPLKLVLVEEENLDSFLFSL